MDSFVGKRIEKLRVSRKLSQSEFARELGVHQTQISKVEKGTSRPSLLLLKAISWRYGVRLEWLSEGSLVGYEEYSLTPDQVDGFELGNPGRDTLIEAVLFNYACNIDEMVSGIVAIQQAKQFNFRNLRDLLSRQKELLDSLEILSKLVTSLGNRVQEQNAVNERKSGKGSSASKAR